MIKHVFTRRDAFADAVQTWQSHPELLEGSNTTYTSVGAVWPAIISDLGQGTTTSLFDLAFAWPEYSLPIEDQSIHHGQEEQS